MSITVTRATACLIQDSGRAAFTHLGVPTSGAWDLDAYDLTRWLLADGNPPVLEVLGGVLELAFDAPAEWCLVGPGSAGIDGAPTPSGSVHGVAAGARLTIRHLGPGPAYLGIGGLLVARTLGSASTCRSGLGPPPLRNGDRFETAPGATPVGRHLRPDQVRRFPGILRYLPDPGNDTAVLADRSWTVTSTARSGVRLRPDALSGRADGGRPSRPVLPGAIQLPSEDEAIVLGPDSGTTGGYPVAGVVISADLPFLSRIPDGARVRFEPVDLAVARNQWQVRADWLAGRRLELGRLG